MAAESKLIRNELNSSVHLQLIDMTEIKKLSVKVFIFIQIYLLASFVDGKVQRDDVEELIHSAGFSSSSYEVETEDFYRLKLHRITVKNRAQSQQPLGPVFFMHGLFATAADYLMTGANTALPFLLSNNGYDCWLGNSRGNDHSLGHKTLSSQSKQYWNFSFHEIGHFDVPAMFDFMLQTTNSSKGYYVGHSQGATSLMVMLSTRPDYNSKIIQAHLLAPAVFMNNLPNPFIRFLSSEFNSFVEKYQAYDFLSTTQIMKLVDFVAGLLCQQNSLFFGACSNAFLMVCGYNANGTEYDPKVVPTLIKHLAHSVSTKQLHHFLQLYHSGKFQQYNYQSLNKVIYRQSSPFEYNLKNVIAPIYIYSGKDDSLVAEKDITRLAEVLPNVKQHRTIRNYNHCDFNYGLHSRKIVFNYIIRSMQESD